MNDSQQKNEKKVLFFALPREIASLTCVSKLHTLVSEEEFLECSRQFCKMIDVVRRKTCYVTV
jgi:hypothetical protein